MQKAKVTKLLLVPCFMHECFLVNTSKAECYFHFAENLPEIAKTSLYYILPAIFISIQQKTGKRTKSRLCKQAWWLHWSLKFSSLQTFVRVQLSNRPQVSMGYKLINHLGCWQNTRRIRKPLACGSWFTNSSRVLPTSRVVYQLINHRNLWSIA